MKTGFTRLLIITVTVALTVYGIREMYAVLSTTTVTGLQWAFLVVFALNFSWIAFSFAQALVGFLGGFLPRLMPRPEYGGELPFCTAILVPVYNEEPGRIGAAIRVMRDGLKTQEHGKFAFFILSDTNQGEHWLEEEAVYRALVSSDAAGCPVYYRHRDSNTERKVGNMPTGCSAVLWLVFVLLGLSIAVQASLARPEYFTRPSLFPIWSVFDAERALWLFGVSMAVILAPQWFGGVLILLHPRRLLAPAERMAVLRNGPLLDSLLTREANLRDLDYRVPLAP